MPAFKPAPGVQHTTQSGLKLTSVTPEQQSNNGKKPVANPHRAMPY